MANDEMSAEREEAQQKFAQAQEAYSRRHLQQAVQLAQEALRIDDRYHEVRCWLAQRYVETGEPHKASREYQTALRADPDNQEAWEGLERVDPASAARLKRLSQIRPDPFVAERQRTGDADFLASLDEIGGTEVASEEMVARAEVGEVFEDTGPEPPAWEFEQDGEYLARWRSEPLVEAMVATVHELWTEFDAFESVLALCAHTPERLQPELFAAAHRAAQRLEVKAPDLYTLPERSMQLVLIKDQPATLAVPTRAMRAADELEMTFLIGRELSCLRSGYLAALQVVEVITERKPRQINDCTDSLRKSLAEQFEPWEAKLDGEGRSRLKKLGHAWQQRAELSADRAGLLCCSDIQAAATAVARMSTPDIDRAERMTLEQFLNQFAGQDPGQLAAIPVAEAPRRSTAYGAYRIQMLRWWATTPEYAELS